MAVGKRNRRHVGAALALAFAGAVGPEGPAAGQAPPEEIRLETRDGVTVFGDLYGVEAGSDRPFLLLFHQGRGDSRGEYGTLVPRLLDAGFQILAIDQRRGGDVFGGQNRTLAAAGDAEYSYCDALPDLEAALEHARRLAPESRLVLWGSSYSAALVIQLAVSHPARVAGVLAFSPATGEPMEGCRPEPWAERLTIPLLALRPSNEAAIPGVAEQLEAFAEQGHETYVADPGRHGSSMLDPARVDGDTEPAWRVVLSFLERVAG